MVYIHIARNILYQPGNETRFLCLSALKLVTVPTELSWLQTRHLCLNKISAWIFIIALQFWIPCPVVCPSLLPATDPYWSLPTCLPISPTDIYLSISPCFFEFKFAYFAWHIGELYFPLAPTFCNFCCFLYLFYTPDPCTSTFLTFLSVNPHPLRLQAW